MYVHPNGWRFSAVLIAAGAVAACGRESGDSPPPTPELKSTAAVRVADAAATTDESAKAALEVYEQRARALSEALAGDSPLTTWPADAEALLDLAAELTPSFIAARPECTAYLNAALSVREQWPTLDAESIERDYHKDGALPKLGSDGAVCYNMKDLVVHPATALVLSRTPTPNRAQAKMEIDEALAHVAAVRATLAGEHAVHE